MNHAPITYDFGVNSDRRRSIGINLSKTELVSEEHFPSNDPDEESIDGFGGWGRCYGD